MYKENNPNVVLVKCPVTEGNPDGFYRLDKAAFVEGEHELYDEEVHSEGMTVAELKDALTQAGMDIPHNARKADLQALFDSL